MAAKTPHWGNPDLLTPDSKTKPFSVSSCKHLCVTVIGLIFLLVGGLGIFKKYLFTLVLFGSNCPISEHA